MREIFGQFVGLVILFIIFAPLERLFALRREQKIFRQGWATDIIHLLLNRFLIDGGSLVVIVVLAVFWRWLINPGFQAQVALQPFWLQFVEAVLIVNISGYFYHRLSHANPFLWRFHSVHHSSAQLDWLASARVHPLDQIFSRAFSFVPLYVLGFTRETFGAYLALAVALAIFNHSNVRLRFGFLRWLIATPEFHHWHHSNDSEARNKNFSGGLPLLDLIFGTFYLPKNKMPETYGISEPMPKSYPAQLVFPFRKTKNSFD